MRDRETEQTTTKKPKPKLSLKNRTICGTSLIIALPPILETKSKNEVERISWKSWILKFTTTHNKDYCSNIFSVL